KGPPEGGPSRSMEMTRRVMVMALAALLGARAGVAQTGMRAAAVAAAPDMSASLEAAARLVEPSVVQSFTTAYAARDRGVPSGGDLVTTQRASGSGVIVDPAGYIVTNAHVVRGVHRVRVEIPAPATGRSILAARSRTVPATVVGLDLETDLAVIKVDAASL